SPTSWPGRIGMATPPMATSRGSAPPSTVTNTASSWRTSPGNPWEKSPGHRKNMLDRDVIDFGVRGPRFQASQPYRRPGGLRGGRREVLAPAGDNSHPQPLPSARGHFGAAWRQVPGTTPQERRDLRGRCEWAGRLSPREGLAPSPGQRSGQDRPEG